MNKDDGGESLDSYKYKLVEEYVAKVAKVDKHVATPVVESGSRPRETSINCLKRKLIEYVKSVNANEFRTAKEWFVITGLCGFSQESSHHYAMMTKLVNEEFLERLDNKLRLEE